MYSKVREIDLGLETTENLEKMLRNELYVNIDSPFADDIKKELDERDKN